jgi:hypothetical protein
MKKIFFILSFFFSLSAFAVHDTTIIDRTCLIEFNWQGKTVEISKPMCKVLLSGQLVYLYDNSQSDHLIYNKTPCTYVLDYRQVETPVCPSADSLRKALIRILNAGNCFSGGATGSGSVTAITPGQGLTTSPNPITTAGTVSVANLGITNAMIANTTINLTQKVTGVLPIVNGGTGFPGWGTGDIPVGISPNLGQLGIGSVGQVLKVYTHPVSGLLPGWITDTIGRKYSSFITGSVPFEGSAHKLIEDNANFFYDSINQTLRTTRQVLTGRSGLIPVTIFPTNSQGLYIESTKGGILVSNTATDVPGVTVRTDGLGMNIDSKEMALKSTSFKEAALFNQTGEASATVANSVVAITRDVNNTNVAGTFQCTGAMLDILNNITTTSVSTGPFVRAQERNVERFVVLNNGRAYLNHYTNIKVSLAGSLGYGISANPTVGSLATDLFSRTVTANTLDNVGDELTAKYVMTLAEVTKTKVLTISFAGVTIYTSPSIALTGASGSCIINFSMMKVSTNSYKYSVNLTATNGTDATPLVSQVYTSAAVTATLTSDQTLKVVGTCQAGSANGGVTTNYEKIMINENIN